jgi:signal transduction histidine kinase
MSLTVMLVVASPSFAALDHGHGGRLALWGLTAGSLLFVPTAIEGIVNVRFPSGSPTGRWGRLLDRVIAGGTLVALLGGVLGDSTVTALAPPGVVDDRVVAGTPLVTIGNVAASAVPLVILLGVLAGIGVVIRFLRSEGLERQQLKWRAIGVVGALVAFPFAVTETLPTVIGDVEPLWFVATLAIPVLRYDLWAIDSIIRRSAVSTLTAPGTVVENLTRTTAEMLRLPYVAVRRGAGVLASAGEPTESVETWPLVLDGTVVGELVAAPRHGYTSVAAPDREILASLAQLIGGSVRAEYLTADLRDARQRLVTAREEERRRLRRDLHDGLGPLLTGLGLNLDAASSHLGRADDKAALYLDNAKAASTEVIDSLRDLVDGLRPPALDELGLLGALRLRVERLVADAGLALDLRVPEIVTLPAAVEVAAYRTVVEAVTNAARHAHARQVRVEVVVEGDTLTVTVGDDGSGAGEWVPGHGLAGMRERAEELGGTFRAGAAAGGSVVRATYPLGGTS